MASGPRPWRQEEGRILSDELYGMRLEALFDAGGKYADVDPNSMVELASSDLSHGDMMEVFLGASNQVVINDMRERFKLMPPLVQVAEFAALPQQSQNLMLAAGYEVPQPEEGKGLFERMVTWDFPLIPEEYLPGVLQAGLAPVRALGFVAGKGVSNVWEYGVMKPSRFATHLGRTGLGMMDQHTSFAYGSPIPIADAGMLNPAKWMDEWNATKVDNDTYTESALRAAEDLIGKERLDMLRLLRRDGISAVEERFLEMGEARGESREGIAQAFSDWYGALENPAEQQAMQVLDSGRRSLSDSIVRMYNAHPLLPDVRPGTAPANIIGGVGALTVEILLDPTTWIGTGYMKVWKASRAGIRGGVMNQQRLVDLYARGSKFAKAAEDPAFAAKMGMQDMTEEAVEAALKESVIEGAEAIPGRFRGGWARAFAPLAKMATGHRAQFNAMNKFIDRVTDVFKMIDAEDEIRRSIEMAVARPGAPQLSTIQKQQLIATRMLKEYPDLPQGLLENLLRDIPAMREAIDHMTRWHRSQRDVLGVIDTTGDIKIHIVRQADGGAIHQVVVGGERVDIPTKVVDEMIALGGGKFGVPAPLPTLADYEGYWKFLGESTEGWKALGALGGTSPAATYLPKIGRFGQQWIKGKQFMNRVYDFGQHSEVLHANISRMTGEFMAKQSGLANRLVSAAIKSGKYVDDKGKEISMVLTHKISEHEVAELLLEGEKASYKALASRSGLTPADMVKIEKARVSLEIVARRQIIEEGHMDELFGWYEDVGYRVTKNEVIDTGKVPHRSATFLGGMRRARRNSLDYYRDNIHPPGSVNDDLTWLEQRFEIVARSKKAVLKAGRKASELTPPEIKAGFSTLAYYPAKFAKKLTTYVPRKQHIDVLDANEAVREFSALVEMGALAHMPRAQIDKYIRTFVMGAEPERWIVQTEFFMDFLGRSGALLHGGRDVQEYIKRFIRHSSARYALSSDDIVSLHGVGMRRAIQPGADYGAELSRLNVIPSYRDLAAVARFMSFYRMIGWGTWIPHLDKLIARTWRPAVLLRLGYVARNGGEELFSWWLREGPKAWADYRVAREAMGHHVVWDAYGRKLPKVIDIGEEVPAIRKAIEAGDLDKARRLQDQLQTATVWRPFGRLWRSFNEVIGAGDYAVTQKSLRHIFTDVRFAEDARQWDFLSDELRAQIFSAAHALTKSKVEQNLFFRLNRNMFAFAEFQAKRLSMVLHETGQAIGLPTRQEIGRRMGIRFSSEEAFDRRVEAIELSLTNPTMQDQYMRHVLGVYDSYLSPHVQDLSAALRQEGFGGSLHALLKLPMRYTEATHIATKTNRVDAAIAVSQKLDRSRDVPGEVAIARALAHHASDDMNGALDDAMEGIISVDPRYRGPEYVGQAAREAEVISPTPGIELEEIVEQIPKATPPEATLDDAMRQLGEPTSGDYRPEGWASSPEILARELPAKAEDLTTDGPYSWLKESQSDIRHALEPGWRTPTGHRLPKSGIEEHHEWLEVLDPLIELLEAGRITEGRALRLLEESGHGIGSHVPSEAFDKWDDPIEHWLEEGLRPSIDPNQEELFEAVGYGASPAEPITIPRPLYEARIRKEFEKSVGGKVAVQAEADLPLEPPKMELKMHFVFGQRGALEAGPGVTSTNTFDAIVNGERTATSRTGADGAKLLERKPGDIIEIVRLQRRGARQSTQVRVVEIRKADSVSPEEWARVEGYKPPPPGTTWDEWEEGRKYRNYTQVVFEKSAPEAVAADLPLERIISGGQTGADQGGLFAAEELGIPTGGMGTKGFKVEGGHDAPLLRDRFGLVEHSSSNYPPRTRENIKQSDGTVIFYPGQGDAGTGLTESLAKELNKPYIIITGRSPASRQRFVDFLRDNNIRTLNVAGNRGSKGGPKFQEKVQKFIVDAMTEARTPKPAVEAVAAATETARATERFTGMLTPEVLQANPDKYYLFGDNVRQMDSTRPGGRGSGQAVIRGQPNAIGIPTKNAANNQPKAFMTDATYDANVAAIDHAFAKIPEGATVVIPEANGQISLGTGRADLRNRAPRTWDYLQDKLAALESPSEVAAPTGSAAYRARIKQQRDAGHTVSETRRTRQLEPEDTVNTHPMNKGDSLRRTERGEQTATTRMARDWGDAGGVPKPGEIILFRNKAGDGVYVRVTKVHEFPQQRKAIVRGHTRMGPEAKEELKAINFTWDKEAERWIPPTGYGDLASEVDDVPGAPSLAKELGDPNAPSMPVPEAIPNEQMEEHLRKIRALDLDPWDPPSSASGREYQTLSRKQLEQLMQYMGEEDLIELATYGHVDAMGIRTELIPLNKDLELMEVIFAQEFETVEEMVAHVRALTGRARGKVIRVEFERLDEVDELVAQVYQGGTEVLEEIRYPGRPSRPRMPSTEFIYRYLLDHLEARKILSDGLDRAPGRLRRDILEEGEETVQYLEEEPWEDVVKATLAVLPEEARPFFHDLLHPISGEKIEDVAETVFPELVARPQTPGGIYGEGEWVETDGFQRWHSDSGDIYVTPDEAGSMGYSEAFLEEQRLSVLPVEGFPHTYEPGGKFVAPVRGMDRTIIDLNQASAEELAQLPGIGLPMARRIVETREKLYFDTLDDLRRVPGITDTKVKRIAESIEFDAQAASPTIATRQIRIPERRESMESNLLAFLLADGVDPRKFTNDFAAIERGLVPTYETPMGTPHGQSIIRSTTRANMGMDPAGSVIDDAAPDYMSRLFVPMIPMEFRGPLVQLLSEGGAGSSTFYDDFTLRLTRKFVDMGMTDVEAGRAARLIHPSTGGQPGITALNYEILARAWEAENHVHFPLVVASSDERVVRAIGQTLEEMMQDLGIPIGPQSGIGLSYLDVNAEALRNKTGMTRQARAMELEDITITLPRPIEETTSTASLADPGDIRLVDPFYSIGKDGDMVRSTDVPGGVSNERVIGIDTGKLMPRSGGLVPVTMVNDNPSLFEVRIFVNTKTNEQVLVQARTATDEAGGVLESVGERQLERYTKDPDWELVDVQKVGGNSLAQKTKEFATIASHEMRNLLTSQSRPGVVAPEVQHAWIREIRNTDGEVHAGRIMDHGKWDDAPDDLIGMLPVSDEAGGVLDRADKFWQKLLTNWFDGVVNPMIGAMVREPMFNYYLLTAMDQTRGVRQIYFLEPKDTATMQRALRKYTDLDEEGQVFIPQLEAFITKSWLGMTPDSDEAVIGLARAIERGDPVGLADHMEHLLETQLLSAEDEDFFRAIYDMAKSKDGAAVNEFFLWAKNRKTRIATHREVGLQRAFHLTGAYIDDHRIRSQFQQMVGTAIPFWFAEDNFLRRLGRGLEHNPMMLRNLHLTMNAGVYGGLIQEDQYGEKHLIIPGSEIAVEYMLEIVDEFPIINKIFGGDLGAVGNPRLATSLNIIPGYDKERMGQMGFGPLLSVPLSFAANRDPSIRENFEANLVGNKFGSGKASDVVLGQIVPAVITRTLNSLGQNWPDPRAREKAKVDIVKFLAISGDMPSQEEIAASDAPELLMEEFLQKVDMMAQQYQLLQGLSWFFGPGTARLSDLMLHEGWEWNSEFISLLNAGVPYEEAYPMWIDRIKKETGEFDPLMYSAFRLSGTTKRTFGVLEVTEEANRWLVDNEPFVRQFGLSSSFFMPRGFDADDDDFSSEAKSRLINYRMRYHKTTAEVATELYYKASYPEYHRSRIAYLKNRYALLARGQDTTTVDRKWHAWSKSWGRQNPVFAARVATGNARTARDDTIHEFELLLAAPALIPDGEYKNDLLVAMQIIVEVNQLFSQLENISGSRAKARRDAARYQSYVFMHELIQGRPWLNEMYYSIFLPLIGETWLAKLEAGMPDIPRSIRMAA